jgi:hypothetical protein
MLKIKNAIKWVLVLIGDVTTFALISALCVGAVKLLLWVVSC